MPPGRRSGEAGLEPESIAQILPDMLFGDSNAPLPRHLSQAELASERARQSLLYAALELARLGPWQYDVATDLFTFNDFFYAILRTTAEREGGYTMHPQRYAERFLHPDDRHIVAEEIKRALETKDPNYVAHLEHRVIFAGGVTGHLSVSVVVVKDERGRTVKTYGVNQDITERVRAKQALEDAHAQLRVLHDNVEDALFSVDVLNRVVLYASPGHARIFGYPVQAFIRNPMLWLERVVPEDKPALEAGEAALRKGERAEIRCRIVRADGQQRWLEARMKPTLDASGNLLRIDGIASDITERVTSEQRRQELEAQLLQAQRVESLGTLAGGIAHDFNNILGIIVGYVAILSSSACDPVLLARALDAISRAATRGTALVNQLLTFARASDASYTAVDLNETIRELMKLFAQTFPKNITTRTRLSSPLPRVLGNASQIHQLLLNLAINGRDAMPDGGILSICTERVEGDVVRARFPDAEGPEYVRVSVQDTGVGMSEAVRRRIFEPFFTTKTSGKGTGLGLAVAFGIIKSHGGRVAVDSKIGHGTTFSVYLKVAEEDEASRACVRSKEKDTMPIGNETVLVVEDEELLRSLLKSVLESRGYTVLTAESGSAGVEAFETHREVAAIVTDMGLPQMDGMELVRRIRAIDRKVKCIMTSGYMTPDTVAKLHHIGVNRTLAKPYEPADLLRVLRNALDAPS